MPPDWMEGVTAGPFGWSMTLDHVKCVVSDAPSCSSMVKDMMVLSVGGRDPHHGALPASQVTCQGHRSAGAFGNISQFLVYLRLWCHK